MQEICFLEDVCLVRSQRHYRAGLLRWGAVAIILGVFGAFVQRELVPSVAQVVHYVALALIACSVLLLVAYLRTRSIDLTFCTAGGVIALRMSMSGTAEAEETLNRFVAAKYARCEMVRASDPRLSPGA
ncbi:MAG TPA: hypothetical protein VGK29_06300 [Paludibaculum sp.]|jgi:hypothetical protein